MPTNPLCDWTGCDSKAIYRVAFDITGKAFTGAVAAQVVADRHYCQFHLDELLASKKEPEEGDGAR